MNAPSDPWRFTILPDVGRVHIRSRLSEGLTLSQLVRKRRDIRHWVVGTLAPKGISLPIDVEHGGAFSAGVAIQRALNWLHETILKLPDASVIAEDWVAKSGDICLNRAKTTYVFARDEVYYVASHPSLREIETLLTDARAAHGIALFAVEAPELSLSRGGDLIGMDQLKELSYRVQIIGVDAYDGENLLFALPRSLLSDDSESA
jgi:hypothetical protein